VTKIYWIKMLICKHDFWRKMVGQDAYTKFTWEDYQVTNEWYCIKCGKVSHKDHTPTEEQQNENIINALSKLNPKGNIGFVKQFLKSFNKERRY